MREGFGMVIFDESYYYIDLRKFGGVISNCMFVYIDKMLYIVVIRFIYNSLFGEKFDVDKFNSRENLVIRSDIGNNIINKIDFYFRFFVVDLNLRLILSGVSDKIDFGVI